jgi:hypothetical protein
MKNLLQTRDEKGRLKPMGPADLDITFHLEDWRIVEPDWTPDRVVNQLASIVGGALGRDVSAQDVEDHVECGRVMCEAMAFARRIDDEVKPEFPGWRDTEQNLKIDGVEFWQGDRAARIARWKSIVGKQIRVTGPLVLDFGDNLNPCSPELNPFRFDTKPAEPGKPKNPLEIHPITSIGVVSDNRGVAPNEQ